MKTLLATAAVLAALTAPALAGQIKVDDSIRFRGPTIACRDFAKLTLLEQFTAMRKGDWLAANRYATDVGCEIWNGGSNLFVVKADQSNYDPQFPSRPIKLCVYSEFTVTRPDANACTWIVVDVRQIEAVQR